MAGIAMNGKARSLAARRAELISTGAELLSGRTVNRHARTLGEALRGLGIHLVRDTTLPDDPAAIRAAVREALDRTDLVFVSGGLGPTPDDVTRDAVASALGRGVVLDESSKERIRIQCERAGRAFSAARASQARVVEGACALENRAGAAPGERLELDGGKVLFILPGPPSEFHSVLELEILPWLRARDPAGALSEDLFMLRGLAEADLVERCREAVFPPAGIALATCAAPGRLEVRLEAADGAESLRREAAERFRALFRERIYAEERKEPVEAAFERLRDLGRTVAAAESCTGGLFGAALTDRPGSSDVYRGGVIAYSNEAKQSLLGVPTDLLADHGAVSEPVARAMAEAARRLFDADFGVGITGIAGPGGETAEKPVGLTFLALADGERTDVRRRVFPGTRAVNRAFAVQTALDMLLDRLV
jgi:nicotinamide-nucleotide amidase